MPCCPFCELVEMRWVGDNNDDEDNVFTVYDCPQCNAELIKPWPKEDC